MCLCSFNNLTTVVDCTKNVARRKKNGNRYHSKMLLNKLDCFRLLYRATLITCSCCPSLGWSSICLRMHATMIDAIIDEDSALLRGQKASEGERERVWNQGCHYNQALHNVLHPFSPCSESPSVSWCVWRWHRRRTRQRWRAKSIFLTKHTSLMHSHIHATVSRLDKQQSHFLSLSLFFFCCLYSTEFYHVFDESSFACSSSCFFFHFSLSVTYLPPFSHFPHYTYVDYLWTSLTRRHVTSDSRTDHNRDSSISLRLFDKRSIATWQLTKSRS